MKIVLNKEFGGYMLTRAIEDKLESLYKIDKKQARFLPRTDERLVKVVEM